MSFSQPPAALCIAITVMDIVLTPERERQNVTLTRFLRRLEAATSRLEDIAGSTEGLGAVPGIGSTTAPRSAVTSSAPTVATPSLTGSSTPSTPRAAPPVEKPRAIADFDLMLSDDLQPFLNLSTKLGGLVAEQVCSAPAWDTNA